MMRRIVPLLFLLTAAGCVDNADSIAREFRNANNEGLDAMMMVTSEAQAGRMKIRVFAPLGDRLKFIERKLDIMDTNLGAKALAREILTSDGMHLYLAELQVNGQRYGLEMTRLRNLYEQYLERERELLRARGEPANNVQGQEVCPELHAIVVTGTTIKPLEQQLKSPKVLDWMNNWAGRVDEKTMKIFKAKRELFAPKVDFKLVF
jgi:hypothetical protein